MKLPCYSTPREPGETLPGSAAVPLVLPAPSPAPMQGHGRSTNQPFSLTDRASPFRQIFVDFRTGLAEMGTVGAASKSDAIEKSRLAA